MFVVSNAYNIWVISSFLTCHSVNIPNFISKFLKSKYASFICKHNIYIIPVLIAFLLPGLCTTLAMWITKVDNKDNINHIPCSKIIPHY